MWHRFSEDLRSACLNTLTPLPAAQHFEMSAASLLISIFAIKESNAVQVLEYCNKTKGPHAETTIGQTTVANKSPCGLSETLQSVLDAAYDVVLDMKEHQVDTDHVVLAALRMHESHLLELSDLGPFKDCDYIEFATALMKRFPGRIIENCGVGKTVMVKAGALRHIRTATAIFRKVCYLSRHLNGPFVPMMLAKKYTLANRYQFYTRLRKKGLYWDPVIGSWFVTRADDVEKLLQHPSCSSQLFSLESHQLEVLPPNGQRMYRTLNGTLERMMLFQDGASHSSFRQLLSRDFGARNIVRWTALIRDTCEQLLASQPTDAQFDLVADFAIPLPASIVAQIIGIDTHEISDFRRWSSCFINYVAGNTSMRADLETRSALKSLCALFARLMANPDAAPSESLIQLFHDAQCKDPTITDDDIVANLLLFVVAGHETTSSLITNAVYTMLTLAKPWEELLANPALIPAAVEEVLRFECPVQWAARIASEDFKYNGFSIRRGQMLNIGLSAANRDPERIDAPEIFNIHRVKNKHFSFGAGPHFCLGAALARLETQIAIEVLLNKAPNIRMLPGTVCWKPLLTFRALEKLPVNW